MFVLANASGSVVEVSTASGEELRRILEKRRLGRVPRERRATISVLRRFRLAIRRRVERSDER
jgi:hypothetical protein